MKLIKEPIFGETPNEAQQLLWAARSSVGALDTAERELSVAMDMFMSENAAAAAAHMGVALQAVRDGKERSWGLQRSLHEAFGTEVPD